MGIKRKLSDIIREIFFPEGITCNVCGKELDKEQKEYSLCDECNKGLVKIKDSVVIRGGHETISAFRYEKTARKYVLFYKDSGKPYIADYIGKYLAEKYAESNIKADEVCFVPSSPSAIKRRGYDGMKYVAAKFSEITGVKLNENLFRKDGIDQTKVSNEKRFENVKDKFMSKGGFSGTVVILDDVVTSGATLGECADVILSHGADKVVCLTFASACEPKTPTEESKTSTEEIKISACETKDK